MISIVVPTWNEAEQLAPTIAAANQSAGEHEMLVVDGGSIDHTVAVARECGVHVILSPLRQRAAQMNLGAEHSSGEIYLFLHADTILPAGSLDRIAESLTNPAVVGGAFARRFRSRSLFLRCTCLLADIRNRTVGWHLGDQGIFVRRNVFFELGGFPPMDRFEDLEFSRRLGRKGRLVTLRPPVISSARRFANGAVRRTVRDFMLTMGYLSGKRVPMKMELTRH